ncbi:putative RNA methyltransferase [Glutamicibacter sp. AOP33-2CA-4]|uniref:putative RNA methyltransferase n=1 Tax=Glutamicibacter sp. AOP33-2CA-4 TaxID=3457690 RepID=UPI0040334345
MSKSTTVLCPVCDQPLVLSTEPRRSLHCPDGHRFDAARQGYFNFLTGRGTNFIEDTGPMVNAREDFQNQGHYAPLAKELSASIAGHHSESKLEVLDAGAGTGYYLGEMIASAYATEIDALALDISRYAMRRAAKLPHTLAMVWDVWRRLPSADQSRDVVLNCFAPHNPAEFHRVLRENGVCLVVTAAQDHLQEIRESLGMLGIAENKEVSLIEKFRAAGLRHQQSTNLTYAMALQTIDLFNLAFMGPAGHHLSPEDLRAKTESLGAQRVNASFGVHIFVREG